MDEWHSFLVGSLRVARTCIGNQHELATRKYAMMLILMLTLALSILGLSETKHQDRDCFALAVHTVQHICIRTPYSYSPGNIEAETTGGVYFSAYLTPQIKVGFILLLETISRGVVYFST